MKKKEKESPAGEQSVSINSTGGVAALNKKKHMIMDPDSFDWFPFQNPATVVFESVESDSKMRSSSNVG